MERMFKGYHKVDQFTGMKSSELFHKSAQVTFSTMLCDITS